MDAQTTTAPDAPPPRSLPHRMHRPPKPARPRGHQTGPAERAAIVGVAVAAAVVAAFAPGQPTRYVVADVVVRAGVAALVTLAASRARRWTWLVLAGLAAVVAPDGLWLAVTAAGLVVAVVTTMFPRRRIYGCLLYTSPSPRD